MRELVFCLVTFAILVAGFLLFYPDNGTYNTQDTAAKPVKTVLEPKPEVRDITPSEITPPPTLETETVERLPAIEPPPPPPRPPKPVQWERTAVIAPGILKSGETKIQLAGVDPLSVKDECEDTSGIKWPCGRFARTELRQFVRGRPIDCEPVEGEKAEQITTRCVLDSYDISAWLVLTGWAKPHAGMYETELAAAKEKERGQWRKIAP